jgi:hypothetical protein
LLWFRKAMWFQPRFSILASSFLVAGLACSRSGCVGKVGLHTGAGPRTRRSCHHHPSSPPTDVWFLLRRQMKRAPRLRASLFCRNSQFHVLVGEWSNCKLNAPSTGKSSNSSSSSSWAACFWGASGCESSLRSETTAFVVLASACAAPDMMAIDVCIRASESACMRRVVR